MSSHSNSVGGHTNSLNNVTDRSGVPNNGRYGGYNNQNNFRNTYESDEEFDETRTLDTPKTVRKELGHLRGITDDRNDVHNSSTGGNFTTGSSPSKYNNTSTTQKVVLNDVYENRGNKYKSRRATPLRNTPKASLESMEEPYEKLISPDNKLSTNRLTRSYERNVMPNPLPAHMSSPTRKLQRVPATSPPSNLKIKPLNLRNNSVEEEGRESLASVFSAPLSPVNTKPISVDEISRASLLERVNQTLESIKKHEISPITISPTRTTTKSSPLKDDINYSKLLDSSDSEEEQLIKKLEFKSSNFRNSSPMLGNSTPRPSNSHLSPTKKNSVVPASELEKVNEESIEIVRDQRDAFSTQKHDLSINSPSHDELKVLTEPYESHKKHDVRVDGSYANSQRKLDTIHGDSGFKNLPLKKFDNESWQKLNRVVLSKSISRNDAVNSEVLLKELGCRNRSELTQRFDFLVSFNKLRKQKKTNRSKGISKPWARRLH